MSDRPDFDAELYLKVQGFLRDEITKLHKVIMEYVDKHLEQIKHGQTMLAQLTQMQNKKVDLIGEHLNMKWGVGWYDVKTGASTHIPVEEIEKEITAGKGGQYL